MRRSDHRTSRERRGRWSTLTFALGVGLIVLMSSSGSAVVVRPPYHGSVTFLGFEYHKGCDTLKDPVSARGKLSTGIVRAEIESESRTCPHLGKNAYSLGGNENETNLMVVLHGTPGVHNLSVTGAVSFTLTSSVTGVNTIATCPSRPFSHIDKRNASLDYNGSSGHCEQLSVAEVEVDTVIFDATNNSTLYGFPAYPIANYTEIENATTVYWVCYGPGYGASAGCHSSNATTLIELNQSATTTGDPLVENGSVAGTEYFNNTTFVKGHVYYLEFSVAGYTLSGAQFVPRGSGIAIADFGSGGRHARLISIVIS